MQSSTTVGNGSLTAGGAIASGLGSIANAGLGIANYFQQSRQYAYERALQQVMFAREDDAVQRRVKDLRAAGLSPVLAAGSAAGSGAVVQTHAPQFGALDDMGQPAKLAMDMLTQDQQIAQSAQQIELSRKQQDKLLSDIEVNKINMLRGIADTAYLQSKKSGQDLQNRVSTIDAQNAEQTGIGGKASMPGQMFKDATGSVTQVLRNTGRYIDSKSPQIKGVRDDLTKKIKSVNIPPIKGPVYRDEKTGNYKINWR